MRFGIQVGLVAVLCVLSGAASAAAIGEPEQTARFGYGINASSVNVEDPDGATNDETELFPWNFVYTDRWIGGFRYWAEGFYQDFSLAPSADRIAQDVERYGVRFSAQRKLEWIESWQIWAGAGVILSKDDFSRRFKVDSDGFLAASYPDRSQNHIGFQVDVTGEWALNRQWDAAARFLYAPAIGDGVEEIGVSLIFLYTP